MIPPWPPAAPATVLQGDCRAALADLPAGAFQTCVTSPPYWGLRTYGTEPQVWGGEQACAHTWAPETKRRGAAGGEREYGSSDGATGRGPAPLLPACAACGACGAWRGELGSEPTVDLWVTHLVEVFRAVRRVLRPDGTLWLNLGDAYSQTGKWGGHSGTKHAHSIAGGYDRARKAGDIGAKQLLGLPWRVAFALQDDGWILRNDIVWHKPNSIPESARDRLTRCHEYIFLFSVRAHRYFVDLDAIREPQTGNAHSRGKGVTPKGQAPGTQTRANNDFQAAIAAAVAVPGGRNARTVWSFAPQSCKGAHFATFPEELPARCILAGTSARGQCPACGAPWRRLVEPTEEYAQLLGKIYHDHSAVGVEYGLRQNGHGPASFQGLATYRTVGWAPTCRCNAGDPVSQWVLDPFLGSGTTLAVARRLGRAGVGVELNPAYLPLAAARIAASPPALLTEAGPVPEAAATWEPLALPLEAAS